MVRWKLKRFVSLQTLPCLQARIWLAEIVYTGFGLFLYLRFENDQEWPRVVAILNLGRAYSMLPSSCDQAAHKSREVINVEKYKYRQMITRMSTYVLGRICHPLHLSRKFMRYACVIIRVELIFCCLGVLVCEIDQTRHMQGWAAQSPLRACVHCAFDHMHQTGGQSQS